MTYACSSHQLTVHRADLHSWRGSGHGAELHAAICWNEGQPLHAAPCNGYATRHSAIWLSLCCSKQAALLLTGCAPAAMHCSHRFKISCRTDSDVLFAAMLQQPRLPPTGQRQAIEVHIKWREVLAQKLNLLNILSRTTGHSLEKLDAVSALCMARCADGCLMQVWNLSLAESPAGCRSISSAVLLVLALHPHILDCSMASVVC